VREKDFLQRDCWRVDLFQVFPKVKLAY